MKRNRREFLKTCCGLGAAGVGAHLTRLGLISAQAQSTSNYRALVCVFFFGGNDSNNLIIPIDSRYSLYQTMRGPVALGQGAVLPAGSSGFGLHPSLTNVQRIFNQGQAAPVFNVGTLFRPTRRRRSTPLPCPAISSHIPTRRSNGRAPIRTVALPDGAGALMTCSSTRTRARCPQVSRSTAVMRYFCP